MMCFLWIVVFRDDEHQLIQQYCQSLNGPDGTNESLYSPGQLMVVINEEQRAELETMITYIKIYFLLS